MRKSHRWALVLALPLLLAGAERAGATTLPLTCNLDYLVSTVSGALSATPRDRVCTAEIVFANGSGGTTSRDYGCKITAGNTSCSLAIDPSASGVPAGFLPATVVTAPLYSSTEETNGCTYYILSGAGTASQTLYPSATILTMPMTSVNILHRFDCVTRP